MKSNPRSICDLFDAKHRYIVPLFQRQYVWSREKQWEPLWQDISDKASARLDQQQVTSHFLGAMVLDQIRTYGNQVPSHIIIDGQQRLTTFQLFLAAFRDFAKKHGHTAYSDEINRYILNPGLMENRETEQFKVWPTKANQEQFSNVITAGSLEDLERIYPREYNKRKTLQPRPQMVEAYL